jgi:hypothetical protein
MTNAETARLLFWNDLKTRLYDLGNPFTIVSNKQWAVVNSTNKSFGKTGIHINYLYRDGIIRMGLWIPGDIELYNRLKLNKEIINSNLFFKPIWQDKGVRGDNVRWIKREISIRNEDAINEVINTINNLLKTVNPYLSHPFKKLESV